jgi:hypothetical protein
MGKKGKSKLKRIAETSIREALTNIHASSHPISHLEVPTQRPQFQFTMIESWLTQRFVEDRMNRINPTVYEIKRPVVLNVESSTEKVRTSVLQEYMETLAPFHEVKPFSLQRLAVMTLAKHLLQSPLEDLTASLCVASSKSIQLFHFYTASFNTMNDDNIAATLQGKVNSLFFSKYITNHGIIQASERLLEITKTAFENLENWEDFLCFELTGLDPRLEVQHITFYQTDVTYESLQLVASHFPQLQSITFLHNNITHNYTYTEYDIPSPIGGSLSPSSSDFDDDSLQENIFLQQLAQVITSFDSLQELVFIQCSWFTYDRLLFFLRHLQLLYPPSKSRLMILRVSFQLSAKLQMTLQQQLSSMILRNRLFLANSQKQSLERSFAEIGITLLWQDDRFGLSTM